MQLVNMIPKLKFLGLLLLLVPLLTIAQENSPYSRYGIGNLVPSGNILNRGMGGISAGFADPTTINFINPSSYANLTYTTLDIGAEVDSRTLKSTLPVSKFTANNAIISYLQVAFPLLSGNKKALKKNISWAATFGLKPFSKINYKIGGLSRIPGIDSSSTTYEGDGGINQAFIGSALRIKNFNIGFNAGYLFGNKNYATRLQFINDTVNYQKSNSTTKTNFGGVYFNAGIQYAAKIKDGFVRLGAYGNLTQKINATQDVVRETYTFNSTGAQITLDSVYTKGGQKGILQLPASYGIGFTIEKPNYLVGIDFESTSWNSYSFFGERDFVKNNWMVRGGFQIFPAKLNSRKYWDFVKYRGGVFYGKNYVNINKNLRELGITAGLGLPLKLKRTFYETQYSLMNISLEYNTVGNKNNNISENILRIGIGFSLSDIWFRRQKFY